MEILDKIKVEMEKIEEKKAALLKELSADFAQIFKPLFDKSEGKVTSFGWTQYSPHFNDGDECTFSVNTYSVYINDQDTDDLEYEEPELYKEVESLIEDFTTFLESIPDEFLESLFGNHKKVTVHADGKTETEYYEHD